MASSSQSSIAHKTWEMSNNILEVNSSEEIYKYDRAQQVVLYLPFQMLMYPFLATMTNSFLLREAQP
jgi:hypothetical protein